MADISKMAYSNAFSWMKMNEFVPSIRIINISPLVQIMAWHRPGTKPLSEPMMASLLMHTYITQPQWVEEMHVKIIFSKCVILSWPLWIYSKMFSSSLLFCPYFNNKFNNIFFSVCHFVQSSMNSITYWPQSCHVSSPVLWPCLNMADFCLQPNNYFHLTSWKISRFHFWLA